MKKSLLLLTSLSLTACGGSNDPLFARENGAQRAGAQLTVYRLDHRPDGGRFGGLSGLAFEGTDASGKLVFLSHTDRGPNKDPYKLDDGKDARPFLEPSFTPEWIRIAVDPRQKTFSVVDQIALEDTQGGLLTGLPNSPARDEVPVDAQGKRLSFDPNGIDPEGIVRAPDGSVWMVEEYGPSLLHFSAQGQLLKRFAPASMVSRQMNRGFEGIALDGNKIYCFLQSPLTGEKKMLAPIVEFDIATEEFTREFLYPFESKETDKIGDAIALGNGRFLVLEQNSKTGAKAFHRIYEVDLSNGEGKPVRKKLVADLVKLGFDFVDKMEGLALIDRQTIALVNDNDFEVMNAQETYLAIVKLEQAL